MDLEKIYGWGIVICVVLLIIVIIGMGVIQVIEFVN